MTATATEPQVVLTAHPLQRVGAFALAALAKVGGVEQLTAGAFTTATDVMASHVGASADVEDAKAPGGFWLGVSYLLWPNSAMNPTSRKRLSPPERRERIAAWRRYPTESLEVPCALCGRVAGGFYGKVDVPLGASTAHRNTTVRGHDGLALCTGCLASFHALPYGCAIGGGRAAAVHSWDDEFLRRVVSVQVGRTLRDAVAGPRTGAPGPYAREVAALRRLRSYERRLTAGVELHVFSNSNKEQILDVHALDQPLAEWLRRSLRDARLRTGFGYLVRAYWTEKIPGSALLARDVFRRPQRMVGRALSYLADLAAESGAPPPETEALAELCLSYSTEVLLVHERDADRIKQLAGQIAGVLAAHPDRGTLKKYEHVHRDARQLQSWLKRQAVAWTLQPGQTQPFITDEQWRLLFESDGQSRFHQDLLMISVLQDLAGRNWRADAADDPSVRVDKEDETLFGEEQ